IEQGFRGLNSFLAREELGEGQREAWGAIQPDFMGGEYLPSLEAGEVEIVRISLVSVTADQISVRARRVDGFIRYSVASEYDDVEDMRYRLAFDQSERPLTLAELVQLIDGAYIPENIFPGGLITEPLELNYDSGADLDSLMGFISIDSPFYPELATYYARVVEEWVNAHSPDDDEDWNSGVLVAM
ncbi:MAG: hypothetical protein OES46_16135, partial [Gammaproteobacteria bacterium]|nr:hypothetical protein [Gammaproteobacteria bacterium]